MLRDAPTPAAAMDVRPHTSKWPTQFRRGLYAFKQVPPPPPVKTPLPDRWPILRDVVAMRFRLAGALVPHRVQGSADQGELETFPKVNMQGALMDLQVLDALFYFAVRQDTGTPRTGTSTLIRAMAEGRNWPLTREIADPDNPELTVTVERTDSQLIDSYMGRIADARWRCIQMGFLGHVRIAWDEEDQERGTDWELLGVPEISEEEYAAADLAIAAYLKRNPSESARALSARLRGQHFRIFKQRIRERLTKAQWDRKNQTAPLPTAVRPFNPGGVIDRSYRVRASDKRVTRPNGTPTPARSATRSIAAVDIITEEGGDGPEVPAVAATAPQLETIDSAGWRDGQQRADIGAGRNVALLVADRLPWTEQERSAISARAAVKLGRLATRAKKLLRFEPEQLADVLAELIEQRDCHLGEAIGVLRRDLKRHPAMPGAARADARRAAADKRRAALLAATPLPDFVRVDKWSQPLVFAPIGRDGQPHLAVTTLPGDLADPDVRLQIHAAAYAAHITGPQRVAQAAVTPHSPLDPAIWPLEDRLAATERLRGNGCVYVIAADGELAIVPPEHSTAAAVRRTIARPPSPTQLDLYRMLLKRQRRLGAEPAGADVGRPGAEPSTFVEMWWAIDALLDELYPPEHRRSRPADAPTDEHWRPNPALAAPEAIRVQVARGLQLIDEHGSVTAAILATHPDRGGHAEDLQAVLEARPHHAGGDAA